MDRKTTARQQSILDVIKDFTREHGYPPSVREIGERVGLSSSSTVQCHLKTLEKKGLIKRDPTKPRALTSESDSVARAVVAVPIVGRIAAGFGTDEIVINEGDSMALPASMVRTSGSFLLKVQGESMVDAAILDGDFVLVSPQKVANNGEIVVASVGEGDATVKTFYKEANRVRLQPQNKYMEPTYSDKVQIVGKVTAVIRTAV